MRKLLVPFDGSDSAHRALAYAISLVRAPAEGSLHLVHAYQDPVVYGELAAYVPPERVSEIQHKHAQEVLAQARPALKAAGVHFTEDVVAGPVAESIVRRAEELGCEAIVMGTRGMTAVGNLLMGSIATRIVHAAQVPVTLVR
jgi:nucleotide-binding universal stress UspA family protein